MKGDFSRIRFSPKKQYTAVLEQQGRVALDADANEQCAIDNYLNRAETVDVIGQYGAPINDVGFTISVSGNEILIGAGRYYVAGLLCENAQNNLAYGSQTFLLDPSPTDSTLLAELQPSESGPQAIQVFLQVWQRLVTALDDPCLRDPALGQADTTARLQTVWRVVANLVPAQPGVDCCTQMYSQTPSPSTGSMAATTSTATGDCSCQPIPAAGYQGLENQLYRVEIHQGGSASTATFKWSRENGSVVAAIVGVSGPTVFVNSLGPDANLGFQPNDWVEISDDTFLFGQTPNGSGFLFQILSVDPSGPSITLKNPVLGINPALNARVRRWDQSGPSAGPNGIPLPANGSATLENGIQVSFGSGSYQSGDYWTIPARVASGTIDWPPCDGDGNMFQPPTSVTVFNAPLACIHWDSVHNQPVVESCQRTFFPLTSVAPGAPSALHITSYSWRNDDLITFDALLSAGLTLTLDAAPTGPVTGANFIVTIEIPNEGFLRTISADPSLYRIIPLNPFILDWQITVNSFARQISWGVPQTNLAAQQTFIQVINNLLSEAAQFGLFARVRVKLLGHLIFAQSGNTQGFLDGQSFGQQALNQFGKPCISLQMPSGNGAKASDFEGWFLLAPFNSISFLSMNFTAFTVVVSTSGVVTAVLAGTPLANVTAQVTVHLAYAPVLPVTVNLSLLSLTQNVTAANFVSLAANSVTFQGTSTETININIFGNPGLTGGVANAYMFQINAEVQLVYGTSRTGAVAFTVNGAPQPLP